jgi:hypothetical protein
MCVSLLIIQQLTNLATSIIHNNKFRETFWYDVIFWSSAVQKVFLVQPLSGTAERVFSLLGQTFGDQQQNALEYVVKCSVMLQYNKC